jgi:hypothetical protein
VIDQRQLSRNLYAAVGKNNRFDKKKRNLEQWTFRVVKSRDFSVGTTTFSIFQKS